MEVWKDLSNVPFPAMVEDAKPTGVLMVKEVSLGNLSLAQLKRLSVVKEDRKDESDEEEI